ncbi:MAG TPA: restriction system-associated AAA family ATPase [Leeuwenhoekiella sp.]|nr:restriction system-associated AAA family ATPase [Leeuwenhoekiella sp.]
MKLIRLKINSQDGFRSLKKGFEIFFLRDFDSDEITKFNPYLLAGKNGSGKSNVLEALAEIFYHLDGIYLSNKPDYFEKVFNPKKSRLNAYELEYFTFLESDFFPQSSNEVIAHVSIKKKSNNRPLIKILNLEEISDTDEDLSQKQIKSLLPRYVVGYASGHNETLSIPFFKSRLLQYDEYYSNLISKQFVDASPESSLVFLDSEFSQAIMLTCLLMFDDPESDEPSPILRPFREYVQLGQIDAFRLILRTDLEIDSFFAKQFIDDNALKLIDNLDLPETNGISNISTRSYIEKLKRCATCWSEQLNPDEGPFTDNYDLDFNTNSYLIFDFKVNNATKRAFQLHFEENPLKLFEFFQLGIILNNFIISKKNKERTYGSTNPFINNDIAQSPIEEDRILRFKDVLLRKNDMDKTIYTKNLSDGEHQFIHTLGLSLLFRNTRSLFLLDEPETHFNPDWKAKYISSVRSCFEKKNSTVNQNHMPVLQDMLITTHSPYLLSDCDKIYVLIFKKMSNSLKIQAPLRPDFQTLGTSVNKIGIRIFGMPNTIGEYAQSIVSKYNNQFDDSKTAEDKEALIKEIKDTLGDSVERMMLINKILDSFS